MADHEHHGSLADLEPLFDWADLDTLLTEHEFHLASNGGGCLLTARPDRERHCQTYRLGLEVARMWDHATTEMNRITALDFRLLSANTRLEEAEARLEHTCGCV